MSGQSLVADPYISNAPIAPNAKRLLLAGFMAILVAGVGLSIRTSIDGPWRHAFGFSDSMIGSIQGAGLTGFCFGVIIAGLLADKIGYGLLVFAAFFLHVLSAVVTLIVPAHTATPEQAYPYLYWGSFIFAVANGTLEGVANPLVATLFPHNRTHYLNMLHASWPAGLVIGSAVNAVLGNHFHFDWKVQIALFIVPVIGYGLLFFGQKMPKSEAAEKGLSFAEMFKDVGMLGALLGCFLLALFFGQNVLPSMSGILHINAAMAANIGYVIGGVLLLIVAVMTRFSIGAWLLFVLFLVHAMVGTVELGTDTWITNIVNALFGAGKGNWVFIYASMLMFLLRFCGHFIEKKLGLSPVGILLCGAIIACIGLNLLSAVQTYFMAFAAITVYAMGKTFFWPTMLAVASDRFPRTGAIAISIMGGVAMLAAGLIGGPGLGYANDRFAGQHLAATPYYAEYRAAAPSKFLGQGAAYGIDANKLDDAQKAGAAATDSQKAAVAAYQEGNRKTLRVDSVIPATMAVIFLLLFIYFKSIGGYKAVHLAGTHGDERMVGLPVEPARGVS